MARILIADDDPLLRALLQHRLASEGHDVVALEDGGGVLSAVEQHRPDLLVLDAMMPVMDGFEILRRLKAGATPDPTPVFMLTALKRESDVVCGLQLGAADYLVKPFIPDELAQRIRRVLTDRFSQDAADVRARSPG